MKILILAILNILFLIACAMTGERTYTDVQYYDEEVYTALEEGDDYEEAADEVIDDAMSGGGVLEEDTPEMDALPPRGEFVILQKNCNVRLSPGGKKIHSLRKGRNLWVEPVDEGSSWYTVYLKQSLAYMHKNCF